MAVGVIQSLHRLNWIFVDYYNFVCCCCFCCFYYLGSLLFTHVSLSSSISPSLGFRNTHRYLKQKFNVHVIWWWLLSWSLLFLLFYIRYQYGRWWMDIFTDTENHKHTWTVGTLICSFRHVRSPFKYYLSFYLDDDVDVEGFDLTYSFYHQVNKIFHRRRVMGRPRVFSWHSPNPRNPTRSE